MEPIEFVAAIHKIVIKNGNNDYREILNGQKSQDLLWRDVGLLYNGLSTEKKKLFMEFIRLIQVNTVSHLFGILDGSSYLNEKRESFILQASSTQVVLNGDLQDLFLEMEE